MVFFALPVGSYAPHFAEIHTPISDNVWTHVAATYSTNTSGLRLYTNGVLAATTTTYGGNSFAGCRLRQTTLPLLIGGTPLYPTAFLSGSMDEIRIWTTARSAQDIYGNMFCRLNGNEPNLAGYWNFDAGTANDLTGHGHNGTLQGSAQVVPIAGSDVVHAGGCGASLVRTATADPVLSYDFVVAADITNWHRHHQCGHRLHEYANRSHRASACRCRVPHGATGDAGGFCQSGSV